MDSVSDNNCIVSHALLGIILTKMAIYIITYFLEDLKIEKKLGIYVLFLVLHSLDSSLCHFYFYIK